MKWETATFCSHSIFTLLSSSILLKQESPVLWSSAVLPRLAAIAQWQSACLVTDCDLGKQEVMSSNLIGGFNFNSDHTHHFNSEFKERKFIKLAVFCPQGIDLSRLQEQ